MPATATRKPAAPAWTRHRPDELRYVGCSDDREIVWLAADSASTPGKVNSVSWDRVARVAHCDCTAAAIGKHECWHAHWAEAAYIAELARQFVIQLDDAALADTGRMARERVDQGQAFWPAASPLDGAILDAARREWCRRQGAAPAPIVALPDRDERQSVAVAA